MRVGRRLCVTRRAPIALNHEWWPMEAINGSAIRSASGGKPMIVRGGSWSIITSGVTGNRLSKSSEVDVDVAYTISRITDPDLTDDFTWLAWMWPESSMLNSDWYTKPFFGRSGWTVAPPRSNYHAISCYNGNLTGQVYNTRKANGSIATSFATLGTIGAKVLVALRYTARTRMAACSKNGAAFVNGATAVVQSPITKDRSHFNLGGFMMRTVSDPNVAPSNVRNLQGKWDDVVAIHGKALSDVDISWLYNSGTGRTYDAAVAYGLFR